ncbi:MAG: hypothetical protein ACHQE5_03640 [Actinomycetes bacterium]
MRFAQTINFRTSRIDELNIYFDAWIVRTEGERIPHHAALHRDRDSENAYQLVVEFPSHDAGMENSSRPQTGEFATFLASICDEPLTFRSFDVIRAEQL